MTAMAFVAVGIGAALLHTSAHLAGSLAATFLGFLTYRTLA